ncbi:MAG: sulfite exporter TauE/SafE family protein [Chitinophagaceae bacterium]|nr:MAG: sulfite exporter TauE/SafE family protein [Chitinophagaceae bacterium]
MFTGMAKTGVHGAGMLAVPLLAMVFGGQESSGVMLPILILADVFGVWYYHRHAEWKFLKVLFPWAALGVVLGTLTGNYIDDKIFRMIMAFVIVSSIVIMIWLERGNKEKISTSIWFTIVIGLAGGFTSMVGNLAGTVMAIYFLSIRLPKNSYVGTTAWFFAVLNFFKIPFHLFVWKTIKTDTVLLDLMTLPAILLGAFLGIIIVRNLSEKIYRWFIISTTMLAAVVMLLKR